MSAIGAEAQTPCTECGALCDETFELEVARQTHWEPAEYQTFCEHCVPARYREPDPDRYRD